MADEKRLIDANAIPESASAFSTEGRLYVAWSEIVKAPTVDAVEVVRCKGCKHWCRNAGIADSPNGHCFCHDIETNGQDFCSYGERRSE